MDRPSCRVYLLRPGAGVDSYGDPVEDWDNPERILLSGAVVQSVNSAEEEDGALSHSRQLFVPRALDVRAEDRIEIDGVIWRVEGDARVRHGLSMGTYTRLRVSRPERRPHG